MHNVRHEGIPRSNRDPLAAALTILAAHVGNLGQATKGDYGAAKVELCSNSNTSS